MGIVHEDDTFLWVLPMWLMLRAKFGGNVTCSSPDGVKAD